MNVKELREKRKAALLAAKELSDAAMVEGRSLSPEERTALDGYVAEIKGLEARLKDADSDDALRAKLNEMGFGVDLEPDRGSRAKAVSVGQMFVESDEYKSWLKDAAPNGYVPEGVRIINSKQLRLKTLLTGESVTSAGTFVRTDYTGIYEPLGRRPLVVRDLITNLETDSDLVEFWRQTAQVTQATVVEEATATSGSSGASPEGAMAFEKVQQPVKNISVWIPATARAIADAAQLRGMIDADLREGVEEKLEDQIVAGDGSSTDGEDFVGIENTSGVLTQTWDTDLLTTARKAVTAVRTTGKSRPTAWLVNPNDAETIDLLQDEMGRYYYGGPTEGGVQRLWRYPVVESEAVTEGQAILGDWRKARLWDRQQASIQMSESHSDFFTRGVVAVRAELRAAFGVIRPSAFILVALSAS